MAKQGHDDNHSDGFERITPAPMRPADTPGGRDAGPRIAPAAWATAALLVLLVIASGVFLWLERSPRPPATQQGAGQTPAEPGTETHPSAKNTPAEPNADQVLAARRHAQELARQLAAKRRKLTEHGVRRWAKSAFTAVGRFTATGKREFHSRDYAEAAATYRQAIAQAGQLLDRVDDVLANALARGQKALKKGNSDSAARAFDLALAVAPGDAKAKQGAARAAHRDRVLALMREGRADEQDGELTAARKSYRQARRLDSAYEPAQRALNRVGAALAERGFDQRMSTGLTALNRGDYAGARNAFSAARKIRPHAVEAADGLAQAEAGLQRQAIAAHQAKAERAAADGHWHTAKNEYDKILAVDPTLAFARQGKKRAAARAGLDDKLSYHLNHPQRLTDASVRADVRQLLTQARAEKKPGPHLQNQIQRLSEHLATASRPEPVQLQSDGHTRVAVYHVARLGTFKTRELHLTPGTYTVVGHRDGYRDVRRQFTVSAGSPAGPISVRCRDKL